MLTLWAVSSERRRRGVLKAVSCAAVVRDAGVGTYTADVPADGLAAQLRDGWRLVIQDDGTIMSGPIVGVTPNLAEKTVTVSGVSDLVLLEDRLTVPTPSLPAEQQTTDAYYKRTGPAETIIRDLVHLNAGTGAIEARRVDGLTVASSQGRGSVVSANLRWKNLLDEARALGRLGGVTFDAVQEQDGRIVVRFRVPVDRSRRVRFTSSNGGVTDGSYTLAAPTATVVVVAGQGSGTDRTIIERSRPTTWGRRIERFKDQRDTDVAAELEQSAVEQLNEGAAGAGASFKAREVPGLVYGVDYQLGDTVTVQLGTATISEPVRAVELRWDGHGRTVDLTLGDHDQADDKKPTWVRRIRELDARVREMETR